jgi:hydrogenase-4 component F
VLLVPVIAPIALALVVLVLPDAGVRRWLIPIGGLGLGAFTLFNAVLPPEPMFGDWLAISPLGRALLMCVGGLCLVLSVVGPGYRPGHSNRILYALAFSSIGPMSLVAMLASHLGLLLPVVAPLTLAAITFIVESPNVRRWLITVNGVLHAIITTFVVISPPDPMFENWLAIAPLSRVLLGFISAQYLVLAFYATGYLEARAERPNRIFCAALTAIIGPMSLVIVAHHLGLMWVAIETATLCTAPLLYFHRNPQSIEATWKYLLIGSVGIALALFGSFFLAYSALKGNVEPSLLFEDMVRNAGDLSKPWLHSAFVVLLVGYGTKIGLAPMHTWKPDAYGEAPGVVGALLAGGLTTCAFCALLRFTQITYAAGDGALARELLLVLGLVSMAVAAVFLARQRDFKRMLAYSSVEHMGIIAFGVGIGGAGTFGALLHLINNGFGKGVLFLAAGNLHRIYGSRLTDNVSGAIRRVPVSGGLFLAGFFAITASPPSGLFISELTILQAAFAKGHYWAAGLFLLFVAVAFMGMGSTVVKVVQGTPVPSDKPREREALLTVLPPLVFLIAVVVLGVYLPDWLDSALHEAAAFVENRV